ncbi:MAG: ROK family protein, partial [Janthinobacterium lividum]
MSGRPASIEGASRSTVTIGIDVGGRTVKGLALDADGVVLATHRIPTPSPDPSGQAVLTAVVTAADRLGHRPGVALGVALPGIVDETRGMAVHSVNLGWRDLPMA